MKKAFRGQQDTEENDLSGFSEEENDGDKLLFW